MTQPAAPAPWYSIRKRSAVAAAALGAMSAAEIFIYGDIGESWWAETVSAAQFVKDQIGRASCRERVSVVV